MTATAFIPVILGGDIGAYSLARASNEAYGVKPLVISQSKSHLIHDSSILSNWVIPNLDKANVFCETLAMAADAYPGMPLLLLACSDWYVSLINAHRYQLAERFIIPYAEADVLTRVTKKESFYELCYTLGIPTPETVVINFGESSSSEIKQAIQSSGIPYPLIAKPENSGAYHYASFPGKYKVFTLHNEEELDDFLSNISHASYEGKFLIQRFIPGDDTAMRILTTYSNQAGKVCFYASGQTLLEDHHPLGIGNPVAIRTLKNEAIAQDARRLLESIGYTGFANFDIKIDPTTGQYYFFDLNARLGRSNYYITCRGYNVIEQMVDDLILSKDTEGIECADNVDTLFSLLPRTTLLKHIESPSLRKVVTQYYTQENVHNPVDNPHEQRLSRIIYPAIFSMRQRQAFNKVIAS